MKAPDFPKRIEIELSNMCNSKCAYCPRNFGVGSEGFMSFSLYRKIVNEAEKYSGVALQLHRRGESLMHPQFIEMLGYVKGKFTDIQLATNAILLDKERSKAIADVVTFLSFSIDLPGAYAAKRGVDAYSTVEKNILDFLRINKKTMVQVSMVKDSSVGDRDIQAFRDLWIDKVDRVRVYEEHSVGGSFGATRIKRDARATCLKPFTDIVIYWNGSAVRCNHDWSKNALGNVNDSTIYEIWNSAGFDKIRREQLSLKFSEGVCKDCDSWYAEEGKQGTGYVFVEKK